jgi:hypothetical protein
MPATITRQGVGDLYRTLGPEIYDRVQAEGFRSLTALLERMDPTETKDRVLGIDAFTRLLAEADIRTYNDPAGDYECSVLGDFGKSRQNQGLFREWCRRQWMTGSVEKKRRRHPHYLERPLTDAQRLAEDEEAEKHRDPASREAILNREGERAAAEFLSGDALEGTVRRPLEDDPTLRFVEFEPAVPLAEIISRTRPTNDINFRARYLTQPTAEQIRLVRVAEAAEIPTAVITESERSVRLRKFGRAVRGSYEALRRLPLEDFAVWIRQLRLQVEVDQVGAAVDVMINGDGNAGTGAVVHNLTALDPATTANNLTVLAWLAFRMKFRNPYALTTVLAREAETLKVLNLNIGTANLLLIAANTPAPFQQNFTPINNRLAGGQRYGITDDAPAARIVGLDNRFGPERLVENGSEISEAERFITNQTELVTFTINEGYMVPDVNAAKLLRLDA